MQYSSGRVDLMLSVWYMTQLSADRSAVDLITMRWWGMEGRGGQDWFRWCHVMDGVMTGAADDMVPDMAPYHQLHHSWHHTSYLMINFFVVYVYAMPQKMLKISFIIPPASTKLKAGYTGFTLSICTSVRPSVDRIVSALYLQQYSLDPFHICTSYQATSENVSRVKFVSKFKKLKFW